MQLRFAAVALITIYILIVLNLIHCSVSKLNTKIKSFIQIPKSNYYGCKRRFVKNSIVENFFDFLWLVRRCSKNIKKFIKAFFV